VSPVYVVDVRISHLIDTSFKQQLFNEHLSTYKILYNNLLPVCNTTNSLNTDQQRDFHRMSELLKTFRQQIIPYPNNYFYGRGIVLSVGPNQLKYAKVNLKMIELTLTRLPVQV
jgi:hypothetical protein